MKIIRPVIVLGFLLTASLACATDQRPPLPETITIQDAVTIALRDNPDSAIAQHRIAEARATSSQVSASDYPLVNISAEYGQTNNPMYSFGNILNQGEFNDSIDFNDPGRTDDLQVKALVSYRIYNGGRDSAGKDAAKANVEAMQSQLVQVRHELSYAVVKTYYAIVQARKMVTVHKQALDSIKAALAVGRARYDAGDLLKQDLLNLELQQSTASEDLIVSQLNLDLTKRSLLNLLGYKEGTFKITESGSGQQQAPTTVDYKGRSELAVLDKLEQAAMATLEKARGSKRPTIDTFASYQLDHGLELDGSGDSWMAGVKVNYNLYDGSRRDSEVAVTRAKLQNLQARIKKTELALSLEVEQAKLKYQQAKERLNVTGKMVGVAKEVTEIARVRFKEGVILSSDLIDFETRLSDALARHLTAEASYQVAIANLRRVSGLEQFSM